MVSKNDAYSKREIESLLEQVNSLSNDKVVLSEERARLSEHVSRLNLDLRDIRQAQVSVYAHPHMHIAVYEVYSQKVVA